MLPALQSTNSSLFLCNCKVAGSDSSYIRYLFADRNTLNILLKTVQSDQKENKPEQALQIIGHVAAEFYANKRS
jgi:hypothetical protein